MHYEEDDEPRWSVPAICPECGCSGRPVHGVDGRASDVRVLRQAAALRAGVLTSRCPASDDTGQAVAALVTQAQADGLAAHQMGGFDTDAVRAEFGLGGTLTPAVVLAIGRRDGTADLPEPLAARKAAPRTRRSVSDLLLPAPSTSELPLKPMARQTPSCPASA